MCLWNWSIPGHSSYGEITQSSDFSAFRHLWSDQTPAEAAGARARSQPVARCACLLVAALHQGAPGQMTWLEDPLPWLRPAYCFSSEKKNVTISNMTSLDDFLTSKWPGSFTAHALPLLFILRRPSNTAWWQRHAIVSSLVENAAVEMGTRDMSNTFWLKRIETAGRNQEVR